MILCTKNILFLNLKKKPFNLTANTFLPQQFYIVYYTDRVKVYRYQYLYINIYCVLYIVYCILYILFIRINGQINMCSGHSLFNNYIIIL